MRRYPIFLLLLLLFFTVLSGTAQDIKNCRYITLDQAIQIARDQSPDALNAKQEFRSSFWAYRTFQGTYLPQVGITAQLPFLNRSIEKYTNPDGTETFLHQQYIDYSANLAISQKVGPLGGTFSVTSGLQRIDNFFSDTTTHNYLSVPFNIGYTQPIFQFNAYRWDKKIQPLKYNQAKRKYLENIEQISLTTTGYFFDLLKAQIVKKIALTNLSNYDTLYRIAKGRYQLGKIAENDLLLLELNFLKAQSAVETANLSLDNALFKFRSFLRINDTIPITLVPPSEINYFKAEPDEAIVQATTNSSQSLDFSRRLLEARRDVRQAKTQNRFSAELTAVYGYTQNADKIDNVYNNPLDQQQVALNLTIPILDWGVSKGNIKVAEAQEEIVKNSVEQEIIDFKRNIYLKVVQFNMQPNQLRIAAKSDTVAKKTYEVTKGRYLIGKINSILDLNNAQIETDDAEMNYYTALQNYWQNYFELRKMTLYDFRIKQPLNFNIKDIRL
ncbi:MAG: TolC family protein [Bacteroidota bacterium]|nr:TolC family protein [Bacteroidota bacterium]